MSEIDKAKTAFAMPFGTELRPEGVRFRIWAPEAPELNLILDRVANPLEMTRDAEGWFELTTPHARVGSRYRYLLPDGLQVPDPASRFQPEDVNGPSEVIDPNAYTWAVNDWTCCSWERTVLYELHIGTFTPEGTFRAAIKKLDHLVELGVTAIEIMSIGDFPGRWNWGYDGVLLYAPDSIYGRPEDLKALVDAAHQHGIMVILDVVYNHFGPEGNYIGQYFPDIVTRQYNTPWGQALNFDAKHSEKTRAFITCNALYWLQEFRMDGLRLDAVHAIIDSSATHIVDDIAAAVRRSVLSRPVHLILESDDRVWHHLVRNHLSMPSSATAQWNHDAQKLLALAFTRDRPVEQDSADTTLLCRALTEGFTSGPQHPNAPANAADLLVGPSGFISFLQTHDVVGNRIRGERLTDLAPQPVVRAISVVYLLAPQIPMLFMGEEWGASSPFPYFCDFKGDLGRAVLSGRLEQFATTEQRADQAFLASVPNPLAETTFLSAKLKWDEFLEPKHRHLFDWYVSVLRVRRDKVLPLLSHLQGTRGTFEVLGARQFQINWDTGGDVLILEGNLSDLATPLFGAPQGAVFWLEGTEGESGSLGPWTIRWSLLLRH